MSGVYSKPLVGCGAWCMAQNNGTEFHLLFTRALDARGVRVSLPTYAVPGIAIVVAATANAILAFGTPLLFGVFPDRRQEGYCDTATLGDH